MKNEHEIKRLDSTKVIFILKGILIGAIAGIIVSLFRLLIEEMMEHMVTLYLWLRGNPVWIIPWALIMLVCAFIVGSLIKSEPNIKGSGIPQVEGTLQGGRLAENGFQVYGKNLLVAFFSRFRIIVSHEGLLIQLGAMLGQGLVGIQRHLPLKKDFLFLVELLQA